MLTKKDQYFKIIAKNEFKNFFNGCSLFFHCLNSLIISSTDASTKIFYAVLYLFVIFSGLFGFCFSFVLIFFVFSLIYQKQYVLGISFFINSFSFIINILGCFGKVKCFCLYRPCQWIFFMILFDLIHLASDIIVFILLIEKNNNYEFNGDVSFILVLCFLGNIGYTIAFFVMHIKIANKLIILFNYLRTLETNVIKFCVFEYRKELKEINN